MAQTRCYGCMQLKEQSPVCEHCGYNENRRNAPHQLPQGTVLRDQYLVGRVLGQGGFGITYLGWDQVLDIPVAIKEYYPSNFVNRENTRSLAVTGVDGDRVNLFENNRERFLREAKALARFNSVPQIVRVFNFFEANNTAYIIMEYVKGIDLRRYVEQRGGNLSVDEAFSILRPVMEAMCEIHETGLVHRDISPDNIMLLPKGGVKLLDFGAVRDVTNARVEQELAKSTMAILKQGFAPLEQYRARGSLGPWTDVYAMCATLYYCMTGDVPLDAPERLLVESEVGFSNIPGLTPRQIDVLNRGMALMPKDRVGSMKELCSGLFDGAPQKTVPIEVPEFSVIPEPPQSQPASAYPSHTLPLESDPVSGYVPPVAYSSESVYTTPLRSSGSDYGHTTPVGNPGPDYGCTTPIINPGPDYGHTTPVINPGPQNYGADSYGPTAPLSGAGQQSWQSPADGDPEKTVPVAETPVSGTSGSGKNQGNKNKLVMGIVAAVIVVIGLVMSLHVWSDPTCTEPSKCLLCGKEGDEAALGHDWQNATCDAPKTCANCGETIGSALSHVYAAATCTEPRTCKLCGTTEGSAAGHSWVDATYESPKHCISCGETSGNVKGYIGDVSGDWSDEKFWRTGRYTWAYELSQTVNNCMSFTLNYEVTDVEYGNIFGNFEVYVRTSGGWKSVGIFKLETYSTSVTFDLDPYRTFDAVVVVCLNNGNWSFSNALSISDVQVYEG